MRNNIEILNWYYVFNEILKGISYLGIYEDLGFESDVINFYLICYIDF